MPSAPMVPMPPKPQSPPVRRQNPDTRNPNPSRAIPVVISRCPNVVRSGRGRRHLRLRRGRRLRGNHSRARRGFLNGSGRGSRRRGIASGHRWRRDINRFPARAPACGQSGQGGPCRNNTKLHLHTQYYNHPAEKVPSPNKLPSASKSITQIPSLSWLLPGPTRGAVCWRWRRLP